MTPEHPNCRCSLTFTAPAQRRGRGRILYRWPWEDEGWHSLTPPLDDRRRRILDAVFDMGGRVIREAERDVPAEQGRLV